MNLLKWLKPKILTSPKLSKDGGYRNSHLLLIETQTATFESWLAVYHGAARHRALPK